MSWALCVERRRLSKPLHLEQSFFGPCMSLVINTNYLSLVVQNNLSKSQAALGTVIERLSSGLRINSAKDDPAGFAIANPLHLQH